LALFLVADKTPVAISEIGGEFDGVLQWKIPFFSSQQGYLVIQVK
jgi:hypothetical protein